MFLVVAEGRARLRGGAARVAAGALAVAMATLLPACGVRYDESFGEETRSRRAAAELRPADSAYAEPSYREQRRARAVVQEMRKTQRKLNKAGMDALFTNAGASSNAADVKFLAESNALNFEIVASDRLNLVDDSPHALTLVVYHLADRLEFDYLAESEEGIRKLLEGKPFDNRAVRGIRQIQIQPGMKGVVTLDRPEGGRHVAMVAGYNRPRTYSSVAVNSYPVGYFIKEIRNAIFTGEVPMFTPERLDLRVYLDETEMRVRPSEILVNNFLDSRQMSFAETQRHLGVY